MSDVATNLIGTQVESAQGVGIVRAVYVAAQSMGAVASTRLMLLVEGQFQEGGERPKLVFREWVAAECWRARGGS